MAANPPKTLNDELEARRGSGCLYVKVSMDGAPYLRKVALQAYGNYRELSSSLAAMFSCSAIGELCSPPREALDQEETGLPQTLASVIVLLPHGVHRTCPHYVITHIVTKWHYYPTVGWFSSAQCGNHEADGSNENRPMVLVHGPQYVLSYQDKDGDWMLVGDVPWE